MMMTKSCWRTCILSTLMLPLFHTVAGSNEILLTQQDYAEKTNGKTVFIKAFAPWCGHCKELAPHWERMAKEWENHKHVLVASVDCTQDESWCVSWGIQGFPTLLFGDPSADGAFLDTYRGEKTYEALSEFANATLEKPICSPGNTAFCATTERNKVQGLWKLAPLDLQASIDKQQNMMKQEEDEFQQAFQSMQSIFDKDSKTHEFQLAKMKAKMNLLQKIIKKN
ncbi:Protein disulfide isomerase [Seminavis robusta]|uniref:Protein disulfide isomerase n=1 Tax=Seminavis robusta TaxID=568900 RepID=A0A9N8EI55_9STRA|nr:Protein disulfide isomerase [Seminavis robusta]|eukprot:Sro972_g226580.1 Protein disulfide isomerase (225) ;mRNA; f:16824-17644